MYVYSACKSIESLCRALTEASAHAGGLLPASSLDSGSRFTRSLPSRLNPSRFQQTCSFHPWPFRSVTSRTARAPARPHDSSRSFSRLNHPSLASRKLRPAGARGPRPSGHLTTCSNARFSSASFRSAPSSLNSGVGSAQPSREDARTASGSINFTRGLLSLVTRRAKT